MKTKKLSERLTALPKSWLEEMGNPDAVGCYIKGDSMEPVIKEGDLVIFDWKPEDPEKLQGKVVVILTVDEPVERWVKILFRDGFSNRYRVESFNDKKYPPTFVRQDLKLTFHRVLGANIRLDNYKLLPKWLPVFEASSDKLN